MIPETASFAKFVTYADNANIIKLIITADTIELINSQFVNLMDRLTFWVKHRDGATAGNTDYRVSFY